MAAPLITAITTVPNRENATNQASFSNDVDTFFSEVNDFQNEANAQAQYLDGVAAEVDADVVAAAESALEASGYASTAVDARNAAIASAVYKGTWEGKTSAGVIGESYSYQGSYIYRLNVNLANISTSEPSPTNTDWQLINVVPFEAPCKATLDLDFANQDFTIYDKLGGFVKRPLADLVSQGRDTAGGSTDAIGGVTEFAAGENRFTFDGETGEALGYLSEESRTNLLTNSEFPNGLSDATVSGLVTLSSIDLGNGSVNALAFEHDGSTSSYALKSNYTLVSGVTYNLSIFVEFDDGLPPTFSSSSSTSPENDFYLYAGKSLSPIDNIVKKQRGGVYKVSLRISGTYSNSLVGVSKAATNSPRTFKVTGYQLEVGSFPTSYIKTLGAAVTRSSDSMTRTLGQEWNPNEGTFVVDARVGGGTYPRVIDLLGSNGLGLHLSRVGTNTSTNTHFGLVSYISATPFSGAIPSDSKIFALSIKGNYAELAADGILYFSGLIPSTVPSSGVITTIGICNKVDGARPSNGTTGRLQYYPRAFDALTLQRLSRIQ